MIKSRADVRQVVVDKLHFLPILFFSNIYLYN